MTADDHHGHDHGSELSDMQLRVRALETILTEKGYIDPAALDAIVEACETKIGPHNGARVVARAWVDPAFKRRLLEDASEAANSLGHISPVGAHLIAVENTPEVHNLVVCTLYSCYPLEGLGDEQHDPRHGRDARLRRSRARAERAGVSRALGRPCPGDAACDGLHAAVDDRRRARLAGSAAAGDLSHRILLPALVSRARKA